MKKWLLTCVAFVLFLAGVSAWRLLVELSAPHYGAPTGEVFVDIPHGAGPSAIADQLVAAGVLRSSLPFLAYLRWSGDSRRLQAGEYRFSGPAAPTAVASRLVRGDVYRLSVTIPEGLTTDDTLQLIVQHGLGEAEALRKAARQTDWIRDLDAQATSLEGYIFPDTYLFQRRAKSEDIVHAMVDQFRARITKLLLDHPLGPHRRLRDIVILASLIEKEARTDEERRLVSSVLYNRLSARMPLACDPSIIYALRLAGSYDGNIRKNDLGIDSPYNTYTHLGLPPGPIANPGESSLRAALSPEVTDYLYFVSRNDGTHQFSTDFRSHELAVRQFQKKSRR